MKFFNRPSVAGEPNPAEFSYGALLCAIKACERSRHESDRDFAQRCARELQNRGYQLKFRAALRTVATA